MAWRFSLIAAPANAQNWAGAEEQLAAKIVAATGPKNMAVEVLNRSSLSAAAADDIRRNLLTQLGRSRSAFRRAGEQDAVTVRVSLSEDLQSYVWVAEIRQGANAASIAMVSLPRSAPLPVEPEAAAVVLRKIPLWSQTERILDVAVTDGNPGAPAGVGWKRREIVPAPGQPLAVGASRFPLSTPVRGRAICGEGWFSPT